MIGFFDKLQCWRSFWPVQGLGMDFGSRCVLYLLDPSLANTKAWFGLERRGKNGPLEMVRLANITCFTVQTSRGSVDDSKNLTGTREHLIKRMFFFSFLKDYASKTGVWLFMYQFPQRLRRHWPMNHKLRNHCQREKQCFHLENLREAGMCCSCYLEVIEESEGWCAKYMDLPYVLPKKPECGFGCRQHLSQCLTKMFLALKVACWRLEICGWCQVMAPQ